MIKRKSPVRHRVKSHARKGKRVQSFMRGNGQTVIPSSRRRALKSIDTITFSRGTKGMDAVGKTVISYKGSPRFIFDPKHVKTRILTNNKVLLKYENGREEVLVFHKDYTSTSEHKQP